MTATGSLFFPPKFCFVGRGSGDKESKHFSLGVTSNTKNGMKMRDRAQINTSWCIAPTDPSKRKYVTKKLQ